MKTIVVGGGLNKTSSIITKIAREFDEIDEIVNVVNKTNSKVINLTNHGFIIMTNSLEMLEIHLNDLEFNEQRTAI